jgi:hypothetical protein
VWTRAAQSQRDQNDLRQQIDRHFVQVQIQVRRRATVSAFVPDGYVTVHEALNLVGRELFPSAWTGEEHSARTGLLSEDEWSEIKDLTPARGGDAAGHRPRMQTVRSNAAATPHRTGDPTDSSYQTEYQARKMYAAAIHRLRVRLEAGHLEAAMLDPWTGTLHRAWPSMWRRPNADQMIEKGEAPIPHNPNTGSLLVKRFADASMHAKLMPTAKIGEVIEVLKEKTATEYLTRTQQKEFVRKTYSSYRVSTRLMDTIVQSVRVRPGRPPKANKKV